MSTLLDLFFLLPAPWVWFTILLFYFTLIGYLALCSIRRAYDSGRLPREVKLVLLPAVGLFFVLDTIFNWFPLLGWLLVLDPPREFLFTSHLKRIKATRPASRIQHRLASYWCTTWLNWADPSGEHC